jgi:hypothetical protein
MFRWVGLVLALGGGITAVVAGANEHWMVTIIGAIIFIVGMVALAGSSKSND